VRTSRSVCLPQVEYRYLCAWLQSEPCLESICFCLSLIVTLLVKLISCSDPCVYVLFRSSSDKLRVGSHGGSLTPGATKQVALPKVDAGDVSQSSTDSQSQVKVL